MKPSTECTQTQTISYDTIARKLSEEADSLIPDKITEQILAEEKIRFHNAALLDIPAVKLVGNNTLRHCKDLLRQKQPLPFLYSVLCFLTEVSILMLIYGTAMGIYGKLTARKGGFLAPFSFLYPLIFFAGIAGYHMLSQKQLSKILSIPFTKASPPEQEKKARLRRLRQNRMICLCAVLLLIAFGTGIVYIFNLSPAYTVSLHICFFAYAACMVLFGIHNVIYNSHAISFFTIGILLAARRPAEEISAALEQYLNLSRRQLLSLSHKNLKDCQRNPELADKLDASIHARMATGRIYDILAIFILLVLDITCVIQMRSITTPALFVFFAMSLLLTLLFGVAFLSANHILKNTKNNGKAGFK